MPATYYEESYSSTYSLTKVFAWLFYAILLTGITCIGLPYLLVYMNAVNAYFGIMMGGIIAVFILSFLGQMIIARTKSKPVAIVVYSLFAISMGIWISPLTIMYQLSTIAIALLTTAGIFGIMALYGTITKRDLSGFGTFLFMILFGCLFLTLINFIIGSYFVDWIISYIVLAIYIGFIAFDIQRVKKIAQSGQLNLNIALLMALNLYIDFIYIFIRLVAIIGSSRND